MKSILFLMSLASVFPSAHAEIKSDTVIQLKALREQIRTWAPLCSDGSLTFHECPYGDSLEYMGMLCLSGDEYFCEQVKKTQSADGRFWRSPGLVGQEWTHRATFSRDMARGAWAYIIAKKDKASAKAWIDYIIGNGNKLCKKTEKGFDACATRAQFWAFATQVSDWLELPRVSRMKGYKFLIDRIYSPIESKIQPLGYPAILTAEAIYSLYEMEKRGAKLRNRHLFEKMAKTLHHRDEENPFFRYLVYGADETTAQNVLKYCNRERPEVKLSERGIPRYTIDFEHPMPEERYKEGGGHYCIFLINILTGSAH